MKNDELPLTAFPELPHWVHAKISELGISKPSEWILRPIPALENRSVLETARLPKGEQVLRNYFDRVSGHF